MPDKTYLAFKKCMDHAKREGISSFIAAVSGGIDSMVMLHCLKRYAQKNKVSFSVGHINHNLRGAESKGDEKFVQQYCSKNEIDCQVSLEGLADGVNIQNEARRKRYASLSKMLKSKAAHAIMTAHNMDDQAITVIQHFLRGSGLQGLSGMSEVSQRQNVIIIRPLLHVSREEIASYADEHEIKYREDSSNNKVKYKRNHLKKNLLPVLKTYNPRIIETISNTAFSLNKDNEALELFASIALKKIVKSSSSVCIEFSRKDLLTLPEAIVARTLQQMFKNLVGSKEDLSSDHLQKTIQLIFSDNGNCCYRFPKGVSFTRKSNILKLFLFNESARKK